MFIQADSLDSAYAALLEDDDILAAQVRGYVPDGVCEHARTHVVHKLMENSVQRIYRSQVRAFTDAVAADPDEGRGYLLRAREVLRALRLAFLPFANPADLFRSDMDELSPYGATLLRFRGRPLVFGMLRSWEPGMEASPHFDVVQESNRLLGKEFRFREQFGVNLFLEAPERGGELLAWNVGLRDLREAGHRAQEGTYGYDIRRLPSPDVVVRPHSGDLVMVRSTRLHAVAETLKGQRITISGFLGMADGPSSFKLWS